MQWSPPPFVILSRLILTSFPPAPLFDLHGCVLKNRHGQSGGDIRRFKRLVSCICVVVKSVWDNCLNPVFFWHFHWIHFIYRFRKEERRNSSSFGTVFKNNRQNRRNAVSHCISIVIRRLCVKIYTVVYTFGDWQTL